MAELIDGPAWLEAAIDQRVALIADRLRGVPVSGDTLIQSALKDPTPGQPVDQWDRTCDNCGRYVPPSAGQGELFFTGSAMRTVHGHPVLICFGACNNCKDVD